MVNGQNKGILKNKMILAIAVFIVFLSIEAMAYNVSIDWTFNQNNYDVELYKCTSNICNSYTSQLLSTFSPGYTYHMSYPAGAYQYHAAFFYKSCYRPMGYIIYNEGDFSTSVSDSFVKKNYCESVIDPLIVTTIQNSTGTYVNITTDVKSAFTVSDDAPGSPKFYPSSHSDYFTSDVKVQMLVDGVLKSEQTVSLYQDTKQTVNFQVDKSTLTPGLHTIRIQTDPIDCICNQGNKYIRYRTVQIEVEQPANTPPVIEGLPDINIDEDTGYWNALIDLWAYSYDNETPDSGLTFSITSQTNNAIVDCIIDHGRYIDCATLPNMNGCSNVTVRVTDPQTLYDEDTFRICVQPINDAPQVGEIPNQTIDSCHQFTQFDLDDYVNDVDNSDNQITWTYSGNNYLSVNINPQHVVTITYPSWFRGSETIRFTATDPHGATDYDDVTFTITECQVPNTPPVIEGLPDLNVNEDTGYWEALIDLWAYAYDNETPDSGLTFSITSQTNNAIVDCIVDHNQHIDCATLPNMNGCSNVTVRVTDPQTLYDEDTFRICVQPINDAPQVGEIPNQTIDSCHQFTQFDLDDYVNDVDNSDNQITWTYSGNNYLSVNINPQHVVTITYPSWFRGSETIRFTATDPHGASDYDDVTFTVTECQGENTPPTLNIPDQTYEESSGMHTIDLWQYAQDNETPDDQLTFIIVNQTHPEIVNCAIRDNRFLDCTVQPNMVGYSDITVRVTDLGGLYDEDTFRITVTEEEIEEDHEVAPSIQITRVIYDDNVMQGGYMHVNIYVQGNKIKNTEARIIIPDLNIDEEFNRFKQIEIKIPEDAETGYHTMEVWVKSNHNEQDRVYEQFFVQPKETKQKTTYEAEGSKTTGSVTASKYNISQETILTLIAISLTIILIIILIMIIATLTTKK